MKFRKVLNLLFQTVLLIVDACNGQIFSPGKRLGRRSGRAVKTVEEICVAGSEKKSSCNSKPDEGTETACDATGFVVSKKKARNKIKYK